MREQPEIDPRRTFALTVVSEGALLVIAMALGWFLSRGPLAQIDCTGDGLALGLLAATPLFAGLMFTEHFPVGRLADLQRDVERLIVPLFRGSTAGELLVIALLAGVAEELLFRGVIQRGVEQLSGSPWLGLAIGSLLFGLAHPISATYAVMAALIGVYLGWLLVATDNLFVPVVTHAAYDFAALIYLVRRQAA